MDSAYFSGGSGAKKIFFGEKKIFLDAL